MISFYTTLILLSWMALAVLCILVQKSSWIPKEDKRRFYLTYGLIAFSAFAEWMGVQLSGNTQIPSWLLSAVKCADYIFTPLAGGAIVTQMKLRNRWNSILMGVLAANAVFQIVASFNQWMIVIDSQNRYTHGPLYMVYVAVYLLVIVLTAIEFRIYGLTYRRQNRMSLYSVLLLVIAGITIQEVFGGEYRTAYIALTMGVSLMFIHYSEFYYMSTDEHIKAQRSQLMKDALSGVFSRHAYMKALERFQGADKVPDNTVVFTVDINGLKAVNDTQGHDVGDELIIGSARCIEKVVGGAGRCYRTGGDEFVVLAHMDKEQANEVLRCLEEKTKQLKGNKASCLSLAAGYALAQEYPGFTIEELAKKADQAMYADKAAYYRKHNFDSRGMY